MNNNRADLEFHRQAKENVPDAEEALEFCLRRVEALMNWEVFEDAIKNLSMAELYWCLKAGIAEIQRLRKLEESLDDGFQSN